MDPSSQVSSHQDNQLPHNSTDAPSLQVDFSWRKWKALITEPGKESQPVYIVDLQNIKTPHLTFKHASSDEVFGTGSVHMVSINAKYELHGRKGQLKALKRFKTEYTHLSNAYSDNEKPMAMRWTSSFGFKKWDFICLDDQENAVAKFSANIWAVKKVGNIHFLGPKAMSPEAREDIVVTGITLWYCMYLRTNNIFNLFGSVFGSPGPIKEGTEGNVKHTDAVENSHDTASLPKAGTNGGLN